MICLCPHNVSSCLCCQCTMGNDWCLCPRMSLLVAPDVLRRVTRVWREWEYAGKTNFTVSHIVQSPASAQLLSTSVWAVLIRINWRGNSSFYKWVPNVTFISLFKNKHFFLTCKWDKSDLKDNLMTWNVCRIFLILATIWIWRTHLENDIFAVFRFVPAISGVELLLPFAHRAPRDFY